MVVPASCSISGMSATTLSMTHHEGDVVWINWSGAILRVVFGAICASIWGIAGLAASSCVIAALHYTASWSAGRWRLSISTHATLRPKLSLLARIPG
jgi:O-antigen/teichoic acid export membrane protein